MQLHELVRAAWQHEIDKGFHEGKRFENTEKGRDEVYKKLALVMTEMAEFLEAMRADELDQTDPKKPSLLLTRGEEEWADMIIRLGGFGAYMGYLAPDELVQEKMDFNKTRPFKHGKNG